VVLDVVLVVDVVVVVVVCAGRVGCRGFHLLAPASHHRTSPSFKPAVSTSSRAEIFSSVSFKRCQL
jgi:hypothetical protein